MKRIILILSTVLAHSCSGNGIKTLDQEISEAHAVTFGLTTAAYISSNLLSAGQAQPFWDHATKAVIELNKIMTGEGVINLPDDWFSAVKIEDRNAAVTFVNGVLQSINSLLKKFGISADKTIPERPKKIIIAVLEAYLLAVNANQRGKSDEYKIKKIEYNRWITNLKS